MAHILYRGGAGRGDNTVEFARAEDFRPDEFLYGEPDAQGAEAARFDGARLEAARFDETPDYLPFDDHPYDDQFAPQTAFATAAQAGSAAGRGRVTYAPTQHPAVHQSLMQAVRDENPAVQHFIDLQHAAEARAAELAAQLAARQREAEDRAAQASARAAQARAAAAHAAHVAQDGYGWAPQPAEDYTDYADPRVQAAAASAAAASIAKATNARHAAVRAQHSDAFDPRAALAAWMPAGGMPWLVRRGAGLASVVMALGLGVWSYDLAQRDIAGLQVIEAPAGPAREAPLDPGGELARHTGLAVNSVAAIGTAAPLAEKITLAPRSAELDEADAPMSALKPLIAPKKADATMGSSDPAADARIYDAAMPIPDASFNMVGQPGVEATSRIVAPVNDDLTPPEADEVMGAGIDAALVEALPDAEPVAAMGTLELDGATPIPASVPGLKTSPRPVPRPNSDLQAEATAVAVADALAPQVGDAQATDMVEVSPEDLASGTRLVQIGAHDSVEQARAEWDRVSVQFASLMEGKRRVIQEAVSGGRTFYRLRVEGFNDVTESRHFCAALVAERTNCIPAQVR